MSVTPIHALVQPPSGPDPAPRFDEDEEPEPEPEREPSERMHGLEVKLCP